MENKNIELKLVGQRKSKGRLMNENLKLDEALCKSFDFLIWSGKTGYLKAIHFLLSFVNFMLNTSFFSLFSPKSQNQL